MEPFIRIVEIWAPNSSRTRLELIAGAYGGLSAFANHSEHLSFEPGQGLPGLLPGPAEQSERSLTQLAIPVYYLDELRSVVCFHY